MDNIKYRPLLIVIAGPNGSGKTYVTSRLLKHEWVEDLVYINPDIVAKDIFGEMYVTDVPKWAQAILPDNDEVQV